MKFYVKEFHEYFLHTKWLRSINQSNDSFLAALRNTYAFFKSAEWIRQRIFSKIKTIFRKFSARFACHHFIYFHVIIMIQFLEKCHYKTNNKLKFLRYYFVMYTDDGSSLEKIIPPPPPPQKIPVCIRYWFTVK